MPHLYCQTCVWRREYSEVPSLQVELPIFTESTAMLRSNQKLQPNRNLTV